MDRRKRTQDESNDDTKRQKLGDGSPAPSPADKIAQAKARIAALQQKAKAPSDSNNDLLARVRERKARAESGPSGASSWKQWQAKGRQQSPGAATTGGERDSNLSSSSSSSKDALANADALLAKIRERKAQAKGTKATGLNAPVHPLFLEKEKKSVETDEERQRKVDEFLRQGQEEEQDDNNPYFDPGLSGVRYESTLRRAKGLQFNPKGKYIEKAEELREQQRLEELKKQIEEQARLSQEQASIKIDIVAGEREYRPPTPPPIEWWDAELLGIGPDVELDTVSQETVGSVVESSINDLVQHPIPIQPPWEKNMPKVASLHMTKAETRRLRKNERAKRLKEQQDRIRLGLDPAPPPKIKPSNVMSVYANEAIKDPTLMEQKAKQAVAERKSKHEQDNQERKLTPEERWQKALSKIERDKSKGLYCAIFRIETLEDGKHKYIVNYNAMKFMFTGITIINPKFCLVIVEGGFLQVKKYSKMLMNRVQWTVPAPPRTEEEEAQPKPDLSSNKCTMVWLGELKTPNFKKWTVHTTETEQDAKDLLARNNAESYWVEARSCLESTS
uniref:ARAD1C00748p n=1 Tax=Blastobotrys adeninivorans TaxID=409370 RepID=A0A060T410_BLAAD